MTQQVPGIGGSFFVSSSLSHLSVTGSNSFTTWSSAPVSVGLRQDVFKPNVAGWDRREEVVRSELAERSYLEAREDIAVQTAAQFFDVFAARMALENAIENSAVNDTLYTVNKGRFEVGKIGENDLLQSELALLRARTTLATGDKAREVYRDLLEARQSSVAVTVPLMQWGARGESVRAAEADRDRTVVLGQNTLETTAQEAHFAALQLSQARRNLALSAKGDTVAGKRFGVALNRYVIGRIAIDNLYLAQNEKDQALNQFVQSLRGYWQAYFRLRRLTLFDFATGKPIQ